MDRNELFEKWVNSLDIPLMAWQKEVLRVACTEPGKELYISMPRNFGRFVTLKLIEQFEQMIKGENMEGKNLTKVIEHPYFKREAAVYERDDKKWGEHVITRTPGNGPEYLAGPIVDRLHEFEKLGYEPTELKTIIEKHEQKIRNLKLAINSVYGTRAFTEPIRVMVTTSGCDTDSVFMKKLKEREKEMKEISEFIEKVKDEVIKTCGVPRSILFPEESPSARGAQFGEIARKAFDDGMNSVQSLTWRHSGQIIGKVNNVEQTKEGLKVTITKNPEYQFKIKRVLFNNPATIVFWADGDKTIVKCQNGEPYDPEKGLAMAISKKALGNDRAYYEEFQKQLGRGQKYSTPEQFNSEVCHIQKLEDLKAAEEDNKTNRALAYDALDYLSKAVNDPKSTKVNLACAMDKAMECLNAILDNY